ncbi:MAG: helix-turn-helix transcriptional regulator [Oligoflexus sp.]|nr:helix-turn-helix transcriptional regulator [Oligoflexus sp.]
MADSSNPIAFKAQALRKQHRLTQSALAEIAGVSLPALQRFEAGNETTQLDTVSKILLALGCELTVRELKKEMTSDE